MSNKVEDLRSILFETIRGVKDGTLPLDRAKAVGELTQVVVNSAKVEVDFIRATNGKGVGTGFLGQQVDEDGKPIAPTPAEPDALPTGIVGRTVHRIADKGEPGQE